jgi:hypothetical protein
VDGQSRNGNISDQRNAGQCGSSKSFDRVLVVERYSLRRGELRFRLSIYKYSNSFLKITTQTRSTSETRRSWSYALDLPLRCRPLRTIRPPPPTVSTELQWGELRRGAFGTCARVAGSFSISEWSVLLPSVATVSTRRLWAVNLEMATFQISEERGAGWE